MESTKDIVFGGHSMVAEDGRLLVESSRFNFNAQITYADVDPRRMQHERRRNKTFGGQEREVDQNAVVVHELSIESPVTETLNKISRTPFVPTDAASRDRLSQEIIQIQAAALARRLLSAKSETMLIGLSGGSDSTLALLVMVEAAKILGWSNDKIIAVTMPGFGTTKRTKSSAEKLGKRLGVTFKTIPITKQTTQMFKDIEHEPWKTDITYENSQARQRTTTLFNLGNKYKGLVIGTGDLSEMCLGWCTYNGDQQSSYAVNIGVPKTLVQHLIGWWSKKKARGPVKEVLETILATKISPELLPPSAKGQILQGSEDKLGPYLFQDFVIYYFLRYGFSADKIFFYAQSAFQGFYTDKQMLEWMTVFFERFPSSQFKRDNIPDGPKVGSVSISPRGDLRLPTEADCSLMLTTVAQLQRMLRR
jgi:NAD+ synthase (glutamine-hydrolysing)